MKLKTLINVSAVGLSAITLFLTLALLRDSIQILSCGWNPLIFTLAAIGGILGRLLRRPYNNVTTLALCNLVFLLDIFIHACIYVVRMQHEKALTFPWFYGLNLAIPMTLWVFLAMVGWHELQRLKQQHSARLAYSLLQIGVCALVVVLWKLTSDY